MKQYKVVQVEPDNDECIDLVNVEDEDDRMMADPDSFKIGETVSEAQIEIHKVKYVDEQGVGTGFMAFRVGCYVHQSTVNTTLKHDV
jgi:hypothetical protein